MILDAIDRINFLNFFISWFDGFSMTFEVKFISLLKEFNWDSAFYWSSCKWEFIWRTVNCSNLVIIQDEFSFKYLFHHSFIIAHNMMIWQSANNLGSIMTQSIYLSLLFKWKSITWRSNVVNFKWFVPRCRDDVVLVLIVFQFWNPRGMRCEVLLSLSLNVKGNDISNSVSNNYTCVIFVLREIISIKNRMRTQKSLD